MRLALIPAIEAVCRMVEMERVSDDKESIRKSSETLGWLASRDTMTRLHPP